MPAFPPDLYTHLVSAFFQGPVPIGCTTDQSFHYKWITYKEETRQCRRPARETIARLAATCRAMRRAVKEAHTRDVHAAVMAWWRSVMLCQLTHARSPQDDLLEGQKRVFLEGSEIHRSALHARRVVP